MKKIILSVLCLISVAAFSQSVKGAISLIIQNEDGKPLEGATVELLRSNDSTLIKTALTDKSGKAEFESILPGIYTTRTTIVSFKPQFSSSFSINENQSSITLPIITLKSKEKTIQGVVVTTKRPFIQKLNDRIVVNVDNSLVSTGNSAFEVLQRSPGVTTDQNDNIALRGKQGVIVMIDGKPTPMTGDDLANYLKNLPASSIDKIDIITNPSSKYDAAGNSGILDIHLKKDQRLGFNGDRKSVV